ncbi:MAG: hypothetical protein WKG32_02745 [Gemmatimonadaceae bacterium]
MPASSPARARSLSRADREVVDSVSAVLDTAGVHAALAALNARVPHRFTGVYRVEAPILRSIRLFDRENPRLEVGADAPLRETYCSLVAADAAPFATDDARDDAGLATHPARMTTIAYCGVPLGDVGTLCHFDLRPQPVPADEIPLLVAVADLVLARLRADGVVAPAVE